LMTGVPGRRTALRGRREEQHTRTRGRGIATRWGDGSTQPWWSPRPALRPSR